jgi:hypothetical protein
MSPQDELIAELNASLRGPRRARNRLLDEIREDLKDAIEAERAAGGSVDSAQAMVAARFGSPAVIADHWNYDQASRQRARRRNTLVLMVAITASGALGITQHASGKSSPTPPPIQCAHANNVAARSSKISPPCQKQLPDRDSTPGPGH